MNDLIFFNHLSNAQNPPERLLRADAAVNRTRLLETAVRLFAAEGVANVHMERIARETGVGKGTLYRHFANKGALCLALMNDQLTAFQNEMMAEMQTTLAEKSSILAQLTRFLTAYVAYLDRNLPLVCEIERDGTQSLNSPGPFIWLNMTVKGLLQMAVATGELPSALDIPFWADILLAPLTAPFFRFLRERRGYDLDRITKNLEKLVTSIQYAK